MNIKAPTKLAVGRVRFYGQHHGEVNCSAFSPDGRTLLTASDDGCVYVWGTKSGRLLWRLAGHRGPVKAGCFSPDGRLIASSSCDRTIRLWDVARSKCLHVLRGHQRSVETVSFSPDSKQLASGGWDKRVILWDVQSGRNVRLLAGHGDSVQSSDFSPTSDSLATGSWDSTVHIWDLRAVAPVVSYRNLEGHTGNISSLCYSPSGLLASGSWDKTIRVWKPTSNSLLLQLRGHTTWVNSLAFSPDEQKLASAGYSRTVPSLNLGLHEKRLCGSLSRGSRFLRARPKRDRASEAAAHAVRAGPNPAQPHRFAGPCCSLSPPRPPRAPRPCPRVFPAPDGTRFPWPHHRCVVHG